MQSEQISAVHTQDETFEILQGVYEMEKEYIISFSSFYKAAYAQEMLDEAGMHASLRKLPAELIHSCGTGLYLRTDSIQQAGIVFKQRQIVPRGSYEIRGQGRSNREYVKIQ